jgi:hypothetical protein
MLFLVKGVTIDLITSLTLFIPNYLLETGGSLSSNYHPLPPSPVSIVCTFFLLVIVWFVIVQSSHTHGVFNMNSISRPIITIVASPSGKKFGVNITADSWQDDYQLIEPFDSAEKANEVGEQFAKVWDEQSTLIESGEIPRTNMLKELTANGVLRAKPKLRDAFVQFRSAS